MVTVEVHGYVMIGLTTRKVSEALATADYADRVEVSTVSAKREDCLGNALPPVLRVVYTAQHEGLLEDVLKRLHPLGLRVETLELGSSLTPQSVRRKE